MSATWCDSEDENEEKTTNRVMTFTGKYKSDSEANDEDISDEELVETYKILYSKWKEACIVGDKLKKNISAFHQKKEKLVSTITGLEDEVTLINSKLENMKIYFRMWKNG